MQLGRGTALLALVFAALCALAAESRADSLTDYLGPREVAMGESQRADARGALATTLNPAGLSLTRELVFEGTFSHIPAGSATFLSIAGCDSTVPVPGCYYYRHLRSNPDLDGANRRVRAHEAGAAFARALSPRLHIGVTVRYFDFESDVAAQPEDTNGFGFDVGALAQLAGGVSLAAVAHNLLGARASQYPRAVGAGLLARPFGALTIAADGVWNLDAAAGESTGRYGGGVQYFFRTSDMQTGYPIRVGGVYDAPTDSTFVTAGLGLVTSKLGVDVGGRVQVGGTGDEVAILASLQIYGPRMVAGPDPLGSR